jgi:hypothetical protein
MAVKMLNKITEVNMICPVCNSQYEMAYSSLSNSFVCLEPKCGFEMEISPANANLLMACVEPAEELVCA